MRRVLPVFLFVAACGGAVVSEPATSAPAATNTNETEAPTETTLGDSPAPTENEAESTTTTSGRPVAPDFSLTLADGSTYTLSEGAKPVYLVFWAEW